MAESPSGKASGFGPDTAGSNPASAAIHPLSTFAEEIVRIRREYNEMMIQSYKDFPCLTESLGPVERLLIEEQPRGLIDFCEKNNAEDHRQVYADAEALGLIIPEMDD